MDQSRIERQPWSRETSPQGIDGSLQDQYDKLQKRLDAVYLDKLDGEITREFYEQKSSQWRREQEDILRKIERHLEANRTY